MFDPKKAAMLIISKHGDDSNDDPGTETGSEDGSAGPEALKAAFEALKKGDNAAAYDAFRAAVLSCESDEPDEGY